MKKIVVMLLLAITAALAVSQLAFAETDCEKRICELATTSEKVTEAKCVIFERTALVAIKTEKFTAKSEYDKYLKELIDNVKSECEIDHVFVTRNPKVMKQIENLSKMSEEQRDEAIQKLIDEVMRHKPRDKFILPKMTGISW